MSLHELATNAARHGALSTHDGAVRISWRTGEDGSLVIDWTESGGPPVAPPPAEGAGLRLVRGLVEYELRGAFSVDFRSAGAVARISIPAAEGHAPLSSTTT
jgi:two-component sensor histidine kinase